MNLIIAPDYPSAENVNRFAFIHSRIRVYNQNGVDFKLFILKENLQEQTIYYFEEIEVIKGNENHLIDFINSCDFNKILIQFINIPIMKAIQNSKKTLPIYIWFHGYEALSWRRRLFYIDLTNILSILKFIKYIKSNRKQLKYLSEFLNINRKQIILITVSNWMRAVVEKDVKVKKNEWNIIPNVIDEELFYYKEKNEKQRTRILIVRSFESKKYANDIAIEFIKKLSEKSYFEELDILIVGKGKLFKKLTNSISKYKNITIRNEFLNHLELSELYRDYGIFLCPTRQDSQGVSMCEAMAAGMIPITSNNTAIPEFVDENSGFLTNSIPEMINSFEELYYHPLEFVKMSQNASNQILNLCSKNNTVMKEIKLINS